MQVTPNQKKKNEKKWNVFNSVKVLENFEGESRIVNKYIDLIKKKKSVSTEK